MYAFRDDQSVLVNQSRVSYLSNMNFPSLSSCNLIIAIFIRLARMMFLPSVLGVSIIFEIVQVYWGCQVLRFNVCSFSVISKGYNFTADVLAYSSTTFLPSVPHCSLSHGCRSCTVDVSVNARHIKVSYSLCFEVFYKDLLLLQKYAFMTGKRGKSYTSLYQKR